MQDRSWWGERPATVPVSNDGGSHESEARRNGDAIRDNATQRQE
jgi:hypothetical protein